MKYCRVWPEACASATKNDAVDHGPVVFPKALVDSAVKQGVDALLSEAFPEKVDLQTQIEEDLFRLRKKKSLRNKVLKKRLLVESTPESDPVVEVPEKVVERVVYKVSDKSDKVIVSDASDMQSVWVLLVVMGVLGVLLFGSVLHRLQTLEESLAALTR